MLSCSCCHVRPWRVYAPLSQHLLLLLLWTISSVVWCICLLQNKELFRSEAKAAIFTHGTNIYVSYKNGKVGRGGLIATVNWGCAIEDQLRGGSGLFLCLSGDWARTLYPRGAVTPICHSSFQEREAGPWSAPSFSCVMALFPAPSDALLTQSRQPEALVPIWHKRKLARTRLIGRK